ncbi:MAG: hypothetical protein HQ559_02390 [Lentisphaerae bacterium]|nr:hypothetical protein [Lentisphaerota bacterium]
MKREATSVGLCVALIFMALVCGCASVPGGIAPSTTPIEGRSYDVLGRVSETDSHIALFGVIPISGGNRVEKAVNDCIRSRGADALIDVTVDGYMQFWVLFSRRVTRVTGTAIKFTRPPAPARALAPAPAPAPPAAMDK